MDRSTDEIPAQQLSAEQQRRAEVEQDLAQQADEPEEVAQHERRAQKADYLHEKLEERRAAED